MAKSRTPLTEEEIAQVEKLVGFGLNYTEIGQFYGFSKKTLERKIKYSPGAKEAIKRGRVRANAEVAQKAYDLAISGKVPAMTMFWLKCRAGWNETRGPVDTDSPDDRVYDTEWGKPEQTEEHTAPVQPDEAPAKD